jgi:ribosomal protein L11 methyltransferase
MANILSGPLGELAPTLAKHTKTGGNIILSGILREQADTVVAAYDSFFDMDTPEFEEDWTLLHGVKK